MRFRTKLLLACLPLALAPLVFFGWRARGDVTDRLGAQHSERVEALADVIEQDLERESASVAARLERLARAMTADNQLRLALRDGPDAAPADRTYLLDYAGRAMRLAGLDVLRIQDRSGRVISSGHFRNEYDAIDRSLPAALDRTDARGILVELPSPTGSVLALARHHVVRVGTDDLALVGGTAVDDRFLDRLAGGTGLDVRLEVPANGKESPPESEMTERERVDAGSTAAASGSTATTADRDTAAAGHGIADAGRATAAPAASREVPVPFVGRGDDASARFVVRAPTGPLDALRRDLDRWLLLTLAAAAGLALILAVVVSRGLGRPLAELAAEAGRVDLERLDAAFPTDRADEIGALSRVLDRMMHRLRASASHLREAERRATIGEIARQVNHDIRNGLVPIRNVVTHLTELERERPDALATTFAERRGTLESSIEYLHTLADDYARLSPTLDPRPCDANAIARTSVKDSTATVDLAPDLPPVLGDPVALRRILDNLVANALESLDPTDGDAASRGHDDGGSAAADGGWESGGTGDHARVVVSTRLDRTADGPRILLAVADTGRGMHIEERARIFDDFYTTRPDGTGLGLSIVRRLVNDLDGRITVESHPGAGTRITVALPTATKPRSRDAHRTGRAPAQPTDTGERARDGTPSSDEAVS